jgi:hypothetical protein
VAQPPQRRIGGQPGPGRPKRAVRQILLNTYKLSVFIVNTNYVKDVRWMRSSRVRMKSSRGIKATECQSRKGFNPSILRHIGILGAADEVLNKVCACL